MCTNTQWSIHSAFAGASSGGHSRWHSTHGTWHAALPPPRSPHRCSCGVICVAARGMLVDSRLAALELHTAGTSLYQSILLPSHRSNTQD